MFYIFLVTSHLYKELTDDKKNFAEIYRIRDDLKRDGQILQNVIIISQHLQNLSTECRNLQAQLDEQQEAFTTLRVAVKEYKENSEKQHTQILTLLNKILQGPNTSIKLLQAQLNQQGESIAAIGTAVKDSEQRSEERHAELMSMLDNNDINK